MRSYNILAAFLAMTAIVGCGRKAPPTLEEQLELQNSTDAAGDLRQRAISYLKRELGDRETFDLQLMQSFSTHPLMGSGEYAIFQFNRSTEPSKRYHVVVGTEGGTNYYPDLGLSLDELWKVHIGTDFYLVMQVKTLDTIDNADRYVNEAKGIIEKTFGGSLQSSPTVVTCFKYKDEVHAAGKCTSGSTVYSFVVGDVPHFAINKDLAADVVWRLNMGRIVCEEAAQEAVVPAK